MNKRDHYYINNNELIIRTWLDGRGSDEYWVYSTISLGMAGDCQRFKTIKDAINYAVCIPSINLETTLQLTKLLGEVRKDENSYIILFE